MKIPPIIYDGDFSKSERIAFLIHAHLNQSITEEEQLELDAWINESPYNFKLFKKLTNQEYISSAINWQQSLNPQQAYARLQEKLPPAKTKRPLYRYLAAASLLLVIMTAYFLYTSESKKEFPVKTTAGQNMINADRAILTLSNGQTFQILASSSGFIATEGGISIEKKSKGEIVYSGKENRQLLNSLSIPHGSQFKLLLSDGTRVWLNAGSELKYPSSFAASREVQLTGEAFFEVSKHPGKPFLVSIRNQERDAGKVEVLGTEFNVNGYADDGKIKITLVEGSVKINNNNATAILKPGQKAELNNNIKILPADIALETAWKNDLFIFKDASMHAIARQLSRWYKVEVTMEENISYHFNGIINRKEPLSKIISLLEKTGRVKFKIDGNKLLVQP